MSPSPGTPLQSGSFTITQPDDDALRSVLGVGADGRNDEPHPLWAFIAPQRGIGTSIAELCVLADFHVDDGPMMGSIEIDFGEPLSTGIEYRVVGEIVALEHKTGRTMGAFDLMTYRERLIAPDGSTTTSVINTFVLPRKKKP